MPTTDDQRTLWDWVEREGFAGVDLADSWIDFSLIDRDVAGTLREGMRSHGLEICGLNCLRKALCRPEYADANWDALNHALDVASWLECPVVSISFSHPTEVRGGRAERGTTRSPGGSVEATDRDYEVTADRLRTLARRAKPLGLTLSVELHHCSLADSSRGLLRILDETRESNVGATPDLINAYWAYAQPLEPWRDAVRALASHCALWHAKNAQRVYVPEVQRATFVERSLGEGDIDYRWALGTMLRSGFGGWISIENCGQADPFETTAQGRRYLERVLDDYAESRLVFV